VSAEVTADAAALASALSSIGVPCRIESRARLAILGTSGAIVQRLAALEMRREVISLAKAHGFTHIAVELSASPPGSGAPVLRD
jgi:hypothetical protein